MSELAHQIIHRLTQAEATLATAESLTAGALASELAEVPGASAVLAGGVISYNNTIKHRLLAVDEELLASQGAVCAEVAAAMADGAATTLGTDYALATTGVAGPDPHQGHGVGEVFIGIHTPAGTRVEQLHFSGQRQQIRAATVATALSLLAQELCAGAPMAD